MPMAMSDAIDNLSAKLANDYINFKEKKNIQNNCSKKNNILFQWLVYFSLKESGVNATKIIGEINTNEATREF